MKKLTNGTVEGLRKARQRQQVRDTCKGLPGRGMKAANARDLTARWLATRSAKNRLLLAERWLREMRHMVREISRRLDELELILRAMDVLETKQAMRNWFNGIVPALGGRPIELCQKMRGRQAVLRELGRIEHGVHS